MPRPLLTVALLFAGGVLAATVLPVPPFLLAGAGLASAAAAFGFARARPVLLCLLAFFAGAANLALHNAVLSPTDVRVLLGHQPSLGWVRGTLSETPTLRAYEHQDQAMWRTLGKLDVTALSTNGVAWRPASGRVAVTTPGALTNLFGGQTVEVAGVIAPPKGPAAEGLFDYRKFLAESGIYYQLQADRPEDWHILASPPSPPLADRFRAWARRALARGLPAEDESLRLEWALTLGWKTALTDDVAEPFVQAAT